MKTFPKFLKKIRNDRLPEEKQCLKPLTTYSKKIKFVIFRKFENTFSLIWKKSEDYIQFYNFCDGGPYLTETSL